MSSLRTITLLAALVWGQHALATAPPEAPTDPLHPGSRSYGFALAQKNILCNGREIALFLPSGSAGPFPVVVFGHGQALGLSSYQATFQHLAKKGVAVAFPAYDTGFFDQDWARMGKDFANLAECAVSQTPELDPLRVVYAGHSKGAYVAGIAAGLASGLRIRTIPRAIILLAPAGFDSATLPKIPRESALTVVFSDRDTVVSRDISETIYTKAGSHRRQFIFLKSYAGTTPPIPAGHMWPVTERGFLGGGPVGALHYHGLWKWLVAAAQDLSGGSRFSDPYLYGAQAADKGLGNLTDDTKRSWE